MAITEKFKNGFTLKSALLMQSDVMHKKGFTLIEVLISLSILITVLFAGIEIFTSILRGNNKATINNEVRQNVQLTMSILERHVRNSESIRFTSASDITLSKTDGTLVEIICEPPTAAVNGRIRLIRTESNGTPTQGFITNGDQTSGVNVSGCNFTVCNNPICSPHVLTVNLTFEQSKFSPTRKDFVVSHPVTSTFSLRSKNQ